MTDEKEKTSVKKPETPFSDWMIKVVATGFGFGYVPVASGTAGALWGIVIYFFLASYEVSPILYVAITAALVLLAIPVSTRAEKIFGKKDCGRRIRSHDRISAQSNCRQFICKSCYKPHRQRHCRKRR